MRNRTVVILVVALVTGGIAAYLAYTFLRTPEGGGQGQQQATGVEVVVAARDLPVGHVVTGEDLKTVEWPVSSVPAGYPSDPSEVLGRGVIVRVHTNEPLLASKLARPEAGGGLPITIPEGMRAVSVAVNQVVGVAGFVLPGTRVDVMVTMQPPGGSGQQSKLVLQDIQVLSAGQTIQQSVDGEPLTVAVVTLLVTPEQAEKLILATGSGQIQLALRNTLDRDTIQTPGAFPSDLLATPSSPTPAPARSSSPAPRRPQGVQVEIYRGPERSTATVDTASGGLR